MKKLNENIGLIERFLQIAEKYKFSTIFKSVAIIFIFGHLGLIENDFLSSTLIQIVVMFAIPLLMYSLLTKKSIYKL